jgi:hypothetical protein
VSRLRSLAVPTSGSGSHLRLSAAGDEDWLSVLAALARALPEAWRPLVTAVCGLDLTATGRAEGRVAGAAAGEGEALLDLPGEDWVGGGSEPAAAVDSDSSDQCRSKHGFSDQWVAGRAVDPPGWGPSGHRGEGGQEGARSPRRRRRGRQWAQGQSWGAADLRV